MIQFYAFTVLRFYRLFVLTVQYTDTLRVHSETSQFANEMILFVLILSKLQSKYWHGGFHHFHPTCQWIQRK